MWKHSAAASVEKALDVFNPSCGEPVDTDAILVQQCRNNDVAAFEALVNRYKNKVYNFVYRMVGNPDDAEDVTQEVFLKVYKRIQYFRGESSFQTWLFRIATNQCVDRSRKLKRGIQQTVSLYETPDDNDDSSGTQREIPDNEADPLRYVTREELRQVVQEGLARLSDKLRAVLVLYDIQGMSYEEIARTLGVPIGTVKSRLFNARAQLARRIRNYVMPR